MCCLENENLFIYHFNMLSLAVWQDTSHTYKNLEYGLGHLWSPIAQWLEHQPVSLKVMGSTPVGGSKNSFLEYFYLRMLLRYLKFLLPIPFKLGQLLNTMTTASLTILFSIL